MATLDTARLAELARQTGGSGSTRSSCRRGATSRCSAWCRSRVGDEIAVLDPLEGFDPEPLAEVLADPEVEILVHAGRQDVAILRREWSTTFTNVFDTQVAAGFAGFSAQAGYNGLLHDVLQDPAAQDGELHALGRAAADRGAAALRAGRRRAPRALADEIARAARGARAARVGARGVPSRSPRPPTSATPRRCGGGCRGSPASTRATARWPASSRPGASAPRPEEDRPVGSVLRDPTVVELAKRQPAGRRELSQIRGVNPDVVRRRGRRRPGRDRARPRGGADPPRRGRAAARPRPSTGR